MCGQTQPEAMGRVVHLNTLPFSIKLILCIDAAMLPRYNVVGTSLKHCNKKFPEVRNMKKPVKETIHAKGIAIGIYTTDFLLGNNHAFCIYQLHQKIILRTLFS